MFTAGLVCDKKSLKRCLSPEGAINMTECSSELDGGGLLALITVHLKNDGSNPETSFVSNRAGSNGGAVNAWDVFEVEFGHRLVFFNNSALQNGGGINLMSGSVLRIIDEDCPAALCEQSRRGNGLCDPGCMSRGCNW